MPRLLSSEITYGGDLEVRFTTTFPLLTAADTAVLRVTDCAGSELAVRIERGIVSDVYLWDSSRSIHQRLLVDDVLIDGCDVRCIVPLILAPAVGGMPRITATLQLNGTLVQSMPASLAPARGRSLSAA